MTRDIYLKAARLVRERCVLVEDESENATYLRVRGDHGDHLVRLSSDNRFACTCTWGSLKGPRGALCSHVAAAVLHQATVAAGLPEERLELPEASDERASAGAS